MYIINKVRLSMTIIMLTVFYFQYYKIQFHCYIHSRLSCINCLSSLSKRTNVNILFNVISTFLCYTMVQCHRKM